jgi:hypothetical protein
MRLPLTHKRSWFASIRLLVAFGAVAALGTVSMSVALAATSTKKYVATIDQVAQNDYTFTLTNDPTSTQTLGSANVSVASGFSDVSVSAFTTAPAGKTWTSVLNGSVIQLRAATTKSALAPGESVSVTITGTAGCAATPYVWPTQVKQSNSFAGLPGNDFLGTSPSVSVIGPPATFRFATIASPQVVDAPFGVSVTAKDACENVAKFYTGSATLSGLASATDGTEPTYGPLAFSGGNGVASASVTAVQSEFVAKLTASNGTATGPSNEFDVVDTVCRSSDQSCKASHDDGTSVFAQVPPEGGTTELSLSGPGRSFACGDSEYVNIGSHVTVTPDYPETQTAPIEIVIEWSLATAPPGSRVICITTSDGATFVVPSCGRTPVPPCELSRSRTVEVLRATLLIAPQDPGFDFG